MALEFHAHLRDYLISNYIDKADQLLSIGQDSHFNKNFSDMITFDEEDSIRSVYTRVYDSEHRLLTQVFSLLQSIVRSELEEFSSQYFEGQTEVESYQIELSCFDQAKLTKILQFILERVMLMSSQEVFKLNHLPEQYYFQESQDGKYGLTYFINYFFFFF